MDDPNLKSVKKEVRSLLVSSSTNLTLKQLLKDYKETTGRDLPFKDYGCKTPMDFLFLMPDVVTANKSNGLVNLTPVEGGKSSHINKLVMNQRKDKRLMGSRKSLYLRSVQKPYTEDRYTKTNGNCHPNRNNAFQPFQSRYSKPPRFHVPTPDIYEDSEHNWDDYEGLSDLDWDKNSEGTGDTEPMTKKENEDAQGSGECVGRISPTKKNYVQEVTSPNVKESLLQQPLVDYNLSDSNSNQRNNSIEFHSDHKVEVFVPPPAEYYSDGGSSASSNLMKFENNDNTTDGHSFSNSTDIEGVNDKLKERFRGLLKEYSKGVLLSKFPTKYKQKFGNRISCADYGFRSFKELVLALPDVFKHEKCRSNDWLLYDASTKISHNDNAQKWIPNRVLENMAILAQKYPNGIYGSKVLELYEAMFQVQINIKKIGFESLTSFLVFCQSVDCKQQGDEIVIYPKSKINESNNADDPPPVPSIDKLSNLWKKYFSDDVCFPTESYKPFVLPPGPFSYLKVRVVDVDSPHKFWIQLFERQEEVFNLMHELNIFYNAEEKDYVMHINTVREGQMCAIKFFEDSRWHRAVITKVLRNLQTKVTFVDYGTTDIVNVTELRYLHRRFAELPIQVIRGELYNLTWPCGHSDWPKDTNHWLFNTSLNKTLVAEISKIDFDEPKLAVVLIDTNDSEDVCINDAMLEQGLAEHVGIVKVIPKQKREEIVSLTPKLHLEMKQVFEDKGGSVGRSSTDFEQICFDTGGNTEEEVEDKISKEAEEEEEEEKEGPPSLINPIPIPCHPKVVSPPKNTPTQVVKSPLLPAPPTPSFHPPRNSSYFLPPQNNGYQSSFNFNMYHPFGSGRISSFHPHYGMNGVFHKDMQRVNHGFFPSLPPPGFPLMCPPANWRSHGMDFGQTNTWNVFHGMPRPPHDGRVPKVKQMLSHSEKGTDTQDLFAETSSDLEKTPVYKPIRKSETPWPSVAEHMSAEKNTITSDQSSQEEKVNGETCTPSSTCYNELNKLLKSLNFQGDHVQINGYVVKKCDALKENITREHEKKVKVEIIDDSSSDTSKKLSRKQKNSLDTIHFDEIPDNWADMLKYPGFDDGVKKTSGNQAKERINEESTTIKEEKVITPIIVSSQVYGQKRDSSLVVCEETLNILSTTTIPFQNFYKIGILGKYIHLLRVGNNFMLPTEEFYKTFSQTTMKIVEYRFHVRNMGKPFITIYEREFPKLFEDLKKENIYGFKVSNCELSVIPLKNIHQVLNHLVPKDERLVGAFEKVQAFETALIAAGKK